MKSLISILTLLGLSLLVRSIFAVTIGYLSYSADRFWGNKAVRCCQCVCSFADSLSSLIPLPPVTSWYDRMAESSRYRNEDGYLSFEHVSCDKSRRKIFAIDGDSMLV